MRVRIVSIVLFTLVFPCSCFNFNNPVDPDAENYQGHRSDPPPDASYRREITIINLGSALSDYQVVVRLNTAAMGSPYQNVNSDGSDLRFADESGTPLSYWIESWNDGGDSLVWVRIPSVPAGTPKIYMYYGNPSAVGLSDGDATFLFFDDFEDHEDGDFVNRWLPEDTYRVVDDGGTKALDDGTAGGQAVVADHADYTDVAVRQRFRSLSGNISYAGLIVRYTDDDNMICAGPQTSSIATILERKASPTFSQLGSDLDITPALDTAYHVQELAVWGNAITLWIDNTLAGAAVSTVAAGGRTGFWSQDGGEQGYRDWQLVRKYVLLEPTVSAIGPEEAL